jgi:hypothetical protein
MVSENRFRFVTRFDYNGMVFKFSKEMMGAEKDPRANC